MAEESASGSEVVSMVLGALSVSRSYELMTVTENPNYCVLGDKLLV